MDLLRDGKTRLPPGFRFEPTDQELVFQYLKCKVFSFSLPASIIPEISALCNYDPWDLPGDVEQERYFFSKKEAKYRNGNKSNRTTDSGYWKATGSDRKIVSSRSSRIHIGMKKTLVFYRGKPPHASRTDWIMHEYRLVDLSQTSNTHFSSDETNSLNKMENWVLCRIFSKKRSSENENEIMETSRKDKRVDHNFVECRTNCAFVGPVFSTASSTSSSSSISHAQISSTGSSAHEECSDSNFNFF